ncbi:MAG: YgjV family protein [Chlamydiia bacterium]|nr:YgjV family protein [Chlamydiia bacterium]
MIWLTENWRELVGYLAPLFIILSMTRSNVKEIRIYMILGCITFVIYGALVQAWPVSVANALIGVVTLVYFLKEFNVKREYHFDGKAAFLEKFSDDLEEKFPEGVPAGEWRTVYHETEIAGFAVLREGKVVASYICPTYRDSSSEAWLKSAFDAS